MVMLALLAGASGQAAAATGPNLNPFADFGGNWRFEGDGGNLSRVTPLPSSGQPEFTEACIPVSNRRTALTTLTWADNHFHLPGLASLKANSLYRLSFTARWDGASVARPNSKLVATVSAGERKNVYVDRLVDLNNGLQVFNVDFVTPLGTSGVAAHTLPTDIAFQAWSAAGAIDGARMCVSKVSLAYQRDNYEDMVTTKTKIVYNQVVTGVEDLNSNTYFTIINPPVGGAVYLVPIDTTKPAQKVKTIAESDTAPDIFSGQKVLSLPLALGTSTWTLEVRDSAGKVADSALVKGASDSFGYTYTRAAPDLRRDALHFFYAQRAGEPIVDGRYSEYRNPFSREAGHVGERAKCYSGTDNFGNDFSGACKTSDKKEAYTIFGRDVSGGWYDAGDHGKYVVNGAISLWALHNVIESHPSIEALNSFFPDGFLKYGTNGVSDLLDEAKHEMRWLLKMQIVSQKKVPYVDPVTNVQTTRMEDVPFYAKVPLGGNVLHGQDVSAEQGAEFGAMLDNLQKRKAGGVEVVENVPTTISYLTYTMPRAKIKLKLSEVDVNGMVFSAVRDDEWTDLPMRPSGDKKPRVLDYPTTPATFAFAAVAAQCARIWKTLDPTFANECKTAAVRAWNAGLAHPDIYRYGEYSDGQGTIIRAINQGGGAYADTIATDEQRWAALELYLSESAVGVPDSAPAQAYLKAFADSSALAGESHKLAFLDFNYAQGFTWKHTRNLGLLSLLANGRDAEIVAKMAKVSTIAVRQPSVSLAKKATEYVGFISESAFGAPHDKAKPFNWASNADIANQAGMLLQAAKYAPDTTQRRGFLMAARRTMSYLLGNNPLGKSYVTGYGTNPVRNPHHRFWAKHKDIAFPPAPPGMLVGGPNAVWDGTLAGAEYIGGSWTLKNNRDAEKYMTEIMPNCMPAGGIGISCYQDDVGLYMTNEVAINWNAALFWAASFLR
jgi:hypothetical protein